MSKNFNKGLKRSSYSSICNDEQENENVVVPDSGKCDGAAGDNFSENYFSNSGETSSSFEFDAGPTPSIKNDSSSPQQIMSKIKLEDSLDFELPDDDEVLKKQLDDMYTACNQISNKRKFTKVQPDEKTTELEITLATITIGSSEIVAGALFNNAFNLRQFLKGLEKFDDWYVTIMIIASLIS